MYFSIDQQDKKDRTSVAAYDDGPGFVMLTIDGTMLDEDFYAEICITPDEARAFAEGIRLIADAAEKRRLIKRTGETC